MDNFDDKHIINSNNYNNSDEYCEVSHSVNQDNEIVPRALMRNDYDLSPGVIPILFYLLSHRPGFKVYNDSITKKFGWGYGRDKVIKYFGELEERGFMKVIKQKRKNGQFVSPKRIVSNSPEFLRSVKPVSPCPESQGTVLNFTVPWFTGPGESGHIRSNLNSLGDLNIEDIKNNNNKIPREEAASVVVCELKKLLDDKEKDCLNLKQLKIWLQEFGEARVRECITYTIKNAQRSPGGFLRRVLENNYNIKSLESEKPIKNEEQEDMIKWTKEETGRYWNKLTDDTKKNKYAGFLTRFPSLEYHMKGKDILDKDVINHPAFDIIMELEGKDHRERIWK